MAFTRLMPTGDLLCPRWCITYKKGKSEGRHGCYGRMWFDEIQSTVVGRAEPHNLRLVHPYQHRVATIRENARCQVGCFPRLVAYYFVLCRFPHISGCPSQWVSRPHCRLKVHGCACKSTSCLLCSHRCIGRSLLQELRAL